VSGVKVIVSAESSKRTIFGPTFSLIFAQSGLEPIKLGIKITFVLSVIFSYTCSAVGT
jgi:hypothetical protein